MFIIKQNEFFKEKNNKNHKKAVYIKIWMNGIALIMIDDHAT